LSGFVPVNSHRRAKQRKSMGERDKMIRIPASCWRDFESVLAMVEAKLGAHAREIQIDFISTSIRHLLEGE
jgi:hypothetical protein